MMVNNIVWLDFNDASDPTPKFVDDTRELREHVLERLEELLAYLYPAGRIRAGKFYVGNIQGSPGRSLVVELDGPKRGLWTDFESGLGGDAIDLWAGFHGRDAKSDFPEIVQGLRDWWACRHTRFSGHHIHQIGRTSCRERV